MYRLHGTASVAPSGESGRGLVGHVVFGGGFGSKVTGWIFGLTVVPHQVGVMGQHRRPPFLERQIGKAAAIGDIFHVEAIVGIEGMENRVQSGSAACRDRGGQDGETSVDGVKLTKKKKK